MSLSDEQVELQVLQIVHFLLRDAEDNWEKNFSQYSTETKKGFQDFITKVEQKWLTARQDIKGKKDELVYYRWFRERDDIEMYMSEPPTGTIWKSEPVEYGVYKKHTKLNAWLYYKWERKGRVERVTKHSAFDARPRDTRYQITQINEDEYNELEEQLDLNVKPE